MAETPCLCPCHYGWARACHCTCKGTERWLQSGHEMERCPECGVVREAHNDQPSDADEGSQFDRNDHAS